MISTAHLKKEDEMLYDHEGPDQEIVYAVSWTEDRVVVRKQDDTTMEVSAKKLKLIARPKN